MHAHTKDQSTSTPSPASPRAKDKLPNPLFRLLGTIISLINTLLKPVAIIAAAVALLSTIALLAITFVASNWIMLTLQLGAFTGALLAVPSALGRFRAGPALALASTGGVLAACAVLTEPAFVTRFLAAGSDPISLYAFGTNIPVLWLAAPQVAAGCILLARSLFMVWARFPARSAWYLFNALWTGIASVALVAAVLAARRPAVMDAIQNALGQWMAQAVVAVGAILGFMLIIGFISACGHNAIRSLETGKLPEDLTPEPSPATAPTTPTPKA